MLFSAKKQIFEALCAEAKKLHARVIKRFPIVIKVRQRMVHILQSEADVWLQSDLGGIKMNIEIIG